MFENIGEKIKIFAIILTVLGVLGSFIGMIAAWVEGEEFLLGLGILVGGVISSYIFSCFIYAFGELVDNSHKIAINTQRTANKQPAPTVVHTTSSCTVKKIPARVVPTATVAATPAPAPAAAPTPAPVVTPAPSPVATIKPVKSNVQPVNTEEEKLYLYGVQMFERRSYQVAYNIFSKIPNYKNVQEYLEKLKTLV